MIGSLVEMDLQQVRALVTVPDAAMLPPPGLFLRDSRIHGPGHVGRVLIHALRLVEATGLVEETPRLWAAVYLHDLARRHDGWSPRHGARACERLAGLPDVQDLFARGGVKEEDLPLIRTAVTLHSRGEAAPDDPARRLTGLLKDADGLDRVRIHDLDVSYLRNPPACTMDAFARRLYRETAGREPLGAGHFAWLWGETARLLAGPDLA